MKQNLKFHEPVLVHEVIDQIGAPLNSQAQIIDATLGTGGHCLELVKNGYKVLGIEADSEIMAVAKERLGKVCLDGGRACPTIVHGNFKDIGLIASENNFNHVMTVLFDLGVSNLQLTSPERGFSFGSPEALLDMRIDRSAQGLTGADLLNALREDQLTVLFGRVLKHFQAKKLAHEVARYRQINKIASVGDLIEISHVVKGKAHLDPATLPFLALRIAVNSELENLSEALPRAWSLLGRGGRILVISFHSLEENIVRDFGRQMESQGFGKVNTAQAIKPTEEELHKNPKSRSAKLNVIEKV
jgi:16S rRNA (cytosine1402-N4)-methyltransferase